MNGWMQAQEMFQLAYELTFYTYHRPEDTIPDLPTSIFEKSIKRIPDPMTYQSKLEFMAAKRLMPTVVPDDAAAFGMDGGSMLVVFLIHSCR